MSGFGLTFGRATLLLIATAVPALAQQGGGCSGFKWPIDREETAFAGEGIPSVDGSAQLPGMMEAATAKLATQQGLTFAVAPTHKPRNTPAYAGVFPIIPIAVPGPYQVTISDGAWIDVVQDGKLLKPTAFTDSKECHTVRKSVRFDLAKGPATVEISDAATDHLMIDVLPSSP